jgi:prolyl oligopeptidase
MLRSCLPSRLFLLGAVLQLGALLDSPPVLAAGPAVPATPKRPVEDVYQGTKIGEDYRWLEDSSSPEVQSWSDAQNAVTRQFLDSYPARGAILERVNALTQSISPLYYGLRQRGARLFALKDAPPRQQPMLVALASVRDTSAERVIVDPNQLDPSGETTIDFFVPSFDGTKVAVSLSKGGTESGTVSVFDAVTGRRLHDEVPRVNGGTAGGSVAWNADGTGFWRTRYPAKSERAEADLPFYQQVYFHRLGTPESADRYAAGKDFPRIAEVTLQTSDDGRFVLADVRNGDGGQHGYWLARAGDAFHRIARFEDGVVDAAFGCNALLLLSRHDALNGKVVILSPGAALASARPLSQARILVPAGSTAIEGFEPTRSRLYVRDIVGGPSEVRVFDLPSGRPRPKLSISSVTTVAAMAHTTGDELAIETTSFTEPARWWLVDPRTQRLEPTQLQLHSPADYSDTEVRREFAVSADGTKIPLNLLMRKGTKLDGSAPCILYGYGGYGISQQPGFSASRKLWIEQGGIYAIANIRGGGEYGEAWHRAGNLTKKQNVFDDFAACAQWLLDHKITRKDRLAVQGGSNGGLLMGAMITQHPDLFHASVSSVGIYDMLRVERTSNGAFNVTEFGTVKDPEQFRALRAYSPYHNVRDGTPYPAVLLTTGANDPRVDPWQSRKMVARLQAASSSRNPILLRTSTTGPGIGAPRNVRNAQLADIYAFLFKVLAIPYRESGKALP